MEFDMKLMKRLQKKLSSKRGFSLSELLMALLVVSLMTVALTTGVSASVRVYNESIRHAEERTLLSTVAEAVMSELRNARDLKTVEGKVTFTSLNYGPGVSFKVDDEGKMKIGYEDEKTKNWNDLIGDGAYIKGKIKLDPGTDGKNTFVNYNAEKELFEVKLTCAGSGESREFSIRPMVDN